MTSRSYRTGVESGISWAYAALTIGFTATWLVVSVAARDRIGPWLWASIAALVVVSVVAGRRGARLRLGNRDVVEMALVSVAIQVAWAHGPEAPIAPGQRCMTTTVVAFGAFAFASRGPRIATIAAAVGAQLAADWSVVGPLDASEGLWPVIAAGIVAAVCIPALRAAARRADEAAERQHLAAVAAAGEEARRRAHRDLQGVLHDDVVAALRAISLPEVSPAEARRAAGEAIGAIERSPIAYDDHAPVDLAQLVRDLTPVPRAVTTIQVGESVLVPGDVARATAAATAEVLRNVARHAHAHRVGVVLEPDGDGFVLTIDDDGVGFRPAAAMTVSHGLRYSVARRLEDVGGRAEVDSAPGRGTTIRLTWQSTSTEPPREATRRERMAAAVGDLRGPLYSVSLPYLLMSGVFAVRYTGDGRLPVWLLAWFAGLCVITLALASRVNTGLSGIEVATALGYGVAGTVASLTLVPPGALHNYSAWPIGAAAPVLVIVAVVRPSWEAMTALLVQQVVIWVAAANGRFDPGPAADHFAAVLPAATSTITPVVLGLVIGRTVLRLGDAVTHANDELRGHAAAESARLAREALHEARLAGLNEEILPFLHAVAEDELVPARNEVRERARTLEHTARDELHLPGVLDATTRDLLRRARAGGCVVTIQTGGADVPAPGVVRKVLTAALSCGAIPRELVLSTQSAEGGSTVDLVTMPGDPDRAAALQHALGDSLSELDSSPEATWAEVTVGRRRRGGGG